MERPRGSDSEVDRIMQTLDAMQLAEETGGIAILLKSNRLASTYEERELLDQAQGFIRKMRKRSEGIDSTTTGELSSVEKLDSYAQALERLKGGRQTAEDGAVLGVCGDLFQALHRVFLLSAYASVSKA